MLPSGRREHRGARGMLSPGQRRERGALVPRGRPLRAGTAAVGDGCPGGGATARQPRRRLWCPRLPSARPGAAPAVAGARLGTARAGRLRRGAPGAGAGRLRAGTDRAAQGGEARRWRGGKDGPSVRPVWPEGAAGRGMLRAGPPRRRRLGFWERVMLGADPRGGAGGAGAAAAQPPAPLPPLRSPAAVPGRGGRGYVGEAALLPPASHGPPEGRLGPGGGGGAAARRAVAGGGCIPRVTRAGSAPAPPRIRGSAGAQPERGGGRRGPYLSAAQPW